MQNFLKVLLAGFMTLNLVAQENNNSINQSFSEVIYSQVMNDLEVNIPIIIATPTLIGFMNISYINQRMFYEQKPDMKKDVFSMSNYSTEQLFFELDNQFIGPLANDEGILLTARYKNRILYNINLNKKENIETFRISSVDKNTSKTIEFDSGIFKKMTVVEPNNLTILSHELDSNIQKEIFYQTSKRKFHITEHQFSGDLLMKTITYKPTTSRNKKKVKSIIKYQYSDDGNILSKVGYNKNEKKRDSLRYFYEDGHLVYIKKFGEFSEGLITLKTTQNRITRLTMSHNEKTIDIEYEYNQNGKASRILVDRNEYNKEDYRFLYNDKSQLISIDRYYNSNVLISKVSFQYDDSDILKAMILIDDTGRILKEVTYSLNHL